MPVNAKHKTNIRLERYFQVAQGYNYMKNESSHSPATNYFLVKHYPLKKYKMAG